MDNAVGMGTALPKAYRTPAAHLLKDLDGVFAGDDGRLPFRPGPLCAALRDGLGEEFVLLGADPAAGKTDLSLNVALSLAEKRKVVVASFEIPDRAVIKRSLPLISCSTGAGALREEDFANRGSLSAGGKAAFEAAVARAVKVLNNVIIVDDRSLGDEHGHTIEAISDAVHTIAQADGVAPALVVDYIQLVKVEGGAFNATDVVDRVSRGLARIAHGERTPVIGIACLGKDGKFRSSSQLSYDPDVILTLHTDARNPDGSRDVTVKVEKFRDGIAPQAVPMKYYPEFHCFTEME